MNIIHKQTKSDKQNKIENFPEKMEAKLKTLEELCELMTIQIVTQNQSFINANCNLINEIRSLKDVIKKQDVSLVAINQLFMSESNFLVFLIEKKKIWVRV